MALTTTGLALLAVAVVMTYRHQLQLHPVIVVTCFVASGAFVGAGLGVPYKQTGLGAAIGPVALVVMFFGLIYVLHYYFRID